MKIRWLEYFAIVAAEESITKAACHLQMSQSALSRIIRDLEISLKVELFQRTGRGLRLTPEGKVVLEKAQKVIEQYTELMETVGDLGKMQLGDLKILIPLGIGRIITKPFFQHFDNQFPKAEAQLFECLNQDTQIQLSVGQADIGIYYSPLTAGKLMGERIALESLYVVGAPGIVGETDAPIPMRQAAQMQFVMQSPPATFRAYVDRCFSNHGYRLKVVRNINMMDTQVQFAQSGEAAAIMAFSAVHREVANGTLLARKITEPEITRDVYIASSSQASTGLQREAIALLKKILRESRQVLRWREPGAASPFRSPQSAGSMAIAPE